MSARTAAAAGEGDSTDQSPVGRSRQSRQYLGRDQAVAMATITNRTLNCASNTCTMRLGMELDFSGAPVSQHRDRC